MTQFTRWHTQTVLTQLFQNYFEYGSRSIVFVFNEFPFVCFDLILLDNCPMHLRRRVGSSKDG